MSEDRCRILINSMNISALKSTNGEYIINGNYTVSHSGPYDVAGTTVNYHRFDGNLKETHQPKRSDGVTEWITSPGPLYEPIHLMVRKHALQQLSRTLNWWEFLNNFEFMKKFSMPECSPSSALNKLLFDPSSPSTTPVWCGREPIKPKILYSFSSSPLTGSIATDQPGNQIWISAAYVARHVGRRLWRWLFLVGWRQPSPELQAQGGQCSEQRHDGPQEAKVHVEGDRLHALQ